MSSFLMGAAKHNSVARPRSRAYNEIVEKEDGTGQWSADPLPNASEGRLEFDLAPNAVTRRPVRPAVPFLRRAA
jgi:hypothetical protein